VAAKPIERYVKKQIADQGGWPRILERIASGETIAGVARTLHRPDGQPISRSFLAHLLHNDPERSSQVKRAQIEGASALVDEGLHLVDSAPVDRDSVNKANMQAQLRLKVAGFIDRQQWGEKPAGVSVNVSVASLHVDALRQRTWVAEVEQGQPLQACDTQELAAQNAMPSVALPTPSDQRDASLT